jgi:hypothetical protein
MREARMLDASYQPGQQGSANQEDGVPEKRSWRDRGTSRVDQPSSA